jgi:hypothetical protein
MRHSKPRSATPFAGARGADSGSCFEEHGQGAIASCLHDVTAARERDRRDHPVVWSSTDRHRLSPRTAAKAVELTRLQTRIAQHAILRRSHLPCDEPCEDIEVLVCRGAVQPGVTVDHDEVSVLNVLGDIAGGRERNEWVRGRWCPET